MSDEARPATSGGEEPSAKLELEPLTPPPAFAAETTVAVAPPAPGAAAAPPPLPPEQTARRKKRIATSVFASCAIHFALAVILFILFPGWTKTPQPEEPIRVELKDWHWVGDDPEADGSGPRGPVPETPPDGPPKGKDVAAGFLDDDAFKQGSIGSGGGPAGSAFAGRVDGKDTLVAAGGGNGETEGAVRLALAWLARHQNLDGTWSARSFGRRCQGKVCGGRGEDEYVSAATAVALLPFLGAGHTHRDGPWKDVVRRGLVALHARQRPDGSFDEGRKHVYADALATIALSEAYGLTRAEPLADGIGRSVAAFVRAQGSSGGWRYAPGDGDADASVTGWVAMALASAKKAGVAVPDETLARCRGFFREQTSAEGTVGYLSAGTGSRSLLGVGYFVPLMLGARPADLAVVGARLDGAAPRWPIDADDTGAAFGVADPMHWYYGSLASFQRGGDAWQIWHARLKPLLLGHQEKVGCAAGSWPAVGQTGDKGGRVVVTALCALSLEVYYRYPRVTDVR